MFNNKACHICGSFDHLSYTCNYHMGRREVFGNTRVNGHNANNITHPNPLSKMIPRSVLLNTGIKPISTARPAVATARRKTEFILSPLSLLLLNILKQGKRQILKRKFTRITSGYPKFLNQQFPLLGLQLPLQEQKFPLVILRTRKG